MTDLERAVVLTDRELIELYDVLVGTYEGEELVLTLREPGERPRVSVRTRDGRLVEVTPASWRRERRRETAIR